MSALQSYIGSPSGFLGLTGGFGEGKSFAARAP